MKKTFIILFLIILLVFTNSCRRSESNTANPSNTQVESIVNTGSDTLVNLALAWAENYHALYPNVEISVTGGGSGTGIAALINGTIDIANASRQIKPEELIQAKANNVDPKEYVVARDAIAIVVNPENLVNHLTIQQLSDIYSGKINNWSEVGGEDRVIVRLSRESNSGTHVFFLENVIRLGDSKNKTLFSPDTLLLPSSEGITAETRDNPNAIGYDGLGYVTPDVKVVAIGLDPTGPFVKPSAETVNNRKYPIARDLYMYTNGQPVGIVLNYINWILSPDAQAIVSELGFVPIKQP
jgi:phosphate transport system substrate-binding protein